MSKHSPLAAIGCLAAIAGGIWPLSASAQSDPILYEYDGLVVLFDGLFGPVKAVQEAARKALNACGSSVTIAPDGMFGGETRTGLQQLAKCPGFEDLGPAARQGSLTEAYWRKLVATDPPTVDMRARTIMLTFENTDYVRAEWNFCQNRPFYEPPANPRCYSNDGSSYLTWGPNGATSGHGSEIQAILGVIERDHPDLLKKAFLDEAIAVQRMGRLRNDDSKTSPSLEVYLCGIWANPKRRAAWKQGFSRFGEEPTVREAYDLAYRSSSFDGGKIAGYQAAYEAFGLAPTEVDHAFFKDRAAHMSFNDASVRAAIKEALAGPNVTPSAVRRALSLKVRPPNQRKDRLGRDVAFYVDSIGAAGLSAEESAAWIERGRRHAAIAGLSDTRAAPRFVAGPKFDRRTPTETATSQEINACPTAVLNPLQPLTKQ